MRYGVARSPEDAREKFRRYGVSTARELFEATRREQPSLWTRIRRRLVLLLRRIDGHDTRDLLNL